MIFLIVALATPFVASGLAIFLVLPLGPGFLVSTQLVSGTAYQNRDAAHFLISWVVNSFIYCGTYLLVHHWRQQMTYRVRQSPHSGK
jgi:hypothetical protein